MNVLFDLDGTLTDSAPGIVRSLGHALESVGHEVPGEQELLRCVGPPIRESFRSLLDTDDEALVARAVDAYRERYGRVGMLECTVYPGISEALATLRERGCNLHVATGKALPYAVRVVEHFGLAGRFRSVHGTGLDGARSDKAKLIAHLLTTEEVGAETAWMVGDREHDVAGARANGVRSVGVPWGYGTRRELAGADADAIACTVSELVSLLA